MALAPLNDPKAERTADNWKRVRRRLRVYFWILMLPALAFLWFAGYGKGLLDGVALHPSCHNERNR